MTSAAVTTDPRNDVRTIVWGGVRLGLATAAGVTVFTLLSRAISGSIETILQTAMVLVGGAVASFWPASMVRPRDVDTIGWTSLLAVVGAVVFTIVDIVILRPVHLYHWTWDAIGGGSGFWYIPIWWMAATFLAGVGATAYAYRPRSGVVAPARLAGETVAIAVLLFGFISGTGIFPFHASVAAMSYGLALVVRVAIAVRQ